jgi:hypothetical protein
MYSARPDYADAGAFSARTEYPSAINRRGRCPDPYLPSDPGGRCEVNGGRPF